MKSICLLGATGSIGQSTLDIVERHPERFRITAVSAHSQVDKLAALCLKHRPQYACIAQESLLPELKAALQRAGLATEALAGFPALEQLAADSGSDTVVAAIVGAAGIASTLS
ncbi:MAG: 1-deoxy-D-xylulose-5-phosphate reductoisomerase, partial [Arenimonas sp.]|nr:1-deoxy-D-xylulose-5-phosphate reductoisomerase [Arenimonas sp.]